MLCFGMVSAIPSEPLFMSLQTAALGFPRIGPRRELKTALESAWSGKTTPSDLLAAAKEIRAASWLRQKALGLAIIPSNDFSLYDQVLDTAAMTGAIPPIYGWTGGEVSPATYFAMARGALGSQTICEHGHVHTSGGVPAMEMTKWFDTNYHYIVPEFAPDQSFALSTTKAVDEFNEAKALGVHTRPVLVGPVTFLKLGKARGEDFDRLSLLDRLLPVYAEVLTRLHAAGADWVQMDEPILVLDLTAEERAALTSAYAALAKAVPGLKILVATYFGELGDNLETAVHLPVAGLHVDLKRGAGQLDAVLNAAPKDFVLSLGVIDGRNVWRADLDAVLDLLEPVIAARGADKIIVAASCSFLHVPIDVAQETRLDFDVKSWLAFAVQNARPGARARPSRCCRQTGAFRAGCRDAPHLAAHPRQGGAGAPEGTDARYGETGAIQPAPRRAAQGACPARLSDDDDRLVPADRGGAQGARRPCQGPALRRRLRILPEESDGRCRPLAGGDRPRRSRPWRVRA
jgi:5-methyltetrahydropteroyltriglutamate--homocysteine methyltransferase